MNYNVARRGGFIMRILILLVVVFVAGILCWGIFTHHRVTGAWSFEPLNPAWWSPRPGDAPPTERALNDARKISDQVGDALWGNDGLIERVEQWWREQPSAANKSQPESAQPETKTKTPSTVTPAPSGPLSLQQLLEQRLSGADEQFRAGLQDLKAASPLASDATISTVDRLARVAAARERFVQVQKELSEAIPAYETLPQHDRTLAAKARQLQAYNKQMLELSGGSGK
jgi:hypothetical protein